MIRRRPAAGLLLAGLLVAFVPMHAATAAPASPVGDATQRAAALRAQVDLLQVQAEQASEHYDAAYDELGRSVTAHLSAQRELTAARSTAGASGDQAGRRIRALYMAGGASGLYASVLSSTDLSDALHRLHQVGAVVDGDRRVAAVALLAASDRLGAEQRLARAAATSARLQSAVAARADAVRALLARTDALLAQADDQVRALAEQQRVADEAAAARRAVAALQTAQTQAAARGLPTGGNPPEQLPIGQAPSSQAATVIAFARAQLGKPYVWGATGPDSYDCSGLTGAAYAAAGIRLPRVAAQQWFAGPHVSLAQLQPGDLLFWATDLANPATIHHEAIYLGGGMMLAAPHSGAFVRVQPVYLDGYFGATRPGPSNGGGM